MYRGFKLELPKNSFKQFISEGNMTEGQKIYKKQSQDAKTNMNDFILNENTLDGSAIQKFWFPQIKADIFLSHSHNDLDEAKALAGWIKSTFGLEVFIDSSVWLHGRDLKQKLANDYCRIENKNLYRYNDLSHAFTHVDIMLSSALAMMINKCECLFFLNTPNSIQPYKNVPRTESAWIYNEIEISKLIEKKKPERWKGKPVRMVETFSKALNGVGVSHELDLDHLTDITQGDLLSWVKVKNKTDNKLDALYGLVNGHNIQILD